MSNEHTTETLPAVVVEEPKAPAPIVTWTPQEIQLIKDTVCRGATDDEFKLFLYICAKTRLDPLTKQIYAVRRYDKQAGGEVMTVQTGIDGYRVIADRNDYAGQDPPIFEFFDKNDRRVPLSATITVYRFIRGQRVAFSHTAYWDEYLQVKTDGTPTRFWKKMPKNQLAKCAEAGALRKAFPNDLSGIYTTDEMAQADNPDVQPRPVLLTPGKEKIAEATQGMPQANADRGDFRWPLGKHEGTLIRDLPDHYLKWFIKNVDKPELQDMAKAELAHRSQQSAGEPATTEDSPDVGDDQPTPHPFQDRIDAVEKREAEVFGHTQAGKEAALKNRKSIGGKVILYEWTDEATFDKYDTWLTECEGELKEAKHAE